MIVVLIGPPGSGKGTQGQLLANKLKLPYLSVGEVFRIMARNNDEDGLLINEYMEKGKLAPVQLVNKVVSKFLLQDKYKHGAVFDGYPRSLEQATFFEKFTTQDIKVIHFNIDEQVLVKRILGRFNCADCGTVYNKYFIKPKVDNICDVCGSKKFVYRKDDNEQTIKRRIEEYQNETYPLINHYKEQGKVYTVDAGKEKEEVERALDRILKMI